MPDTLGPQAELSAQERIYLIRAKIERAKKNLADFEAEAITFRHDTQHVLVEELNPASGQVFDDFREVRRLPFNAVGAAGDVIHNLRTALDHLANQLVLVAGNSPTRLTEFPIAKDEATYTKDKGRKVEGMRPEAVEAIDRLKPYRGGNEALWRLHELDNIDKHRMLFTVGQDTLFTADWIEDFFGFKQFFVKASSPHFSGVFDAEVENDIDAEITKAVNQTKVLQSDALLPTLHHLVDVVEDLVLGFEPLLKR